jgi:DNA polymerase-3 subunit delta
MAAGKKFTFLCGPDDFLVDRLGKDRFDELTRDVTDEFAREVLSGFANNVGEVETVINRFRESPCRPSPCSAAGASSG